LHTRRISCSLRPRLRGRVRTRGNERPPLRSPMGRPAGRTQTLAATVQKQPRSTTTRQLRLPAPGAGWSKSCA
jgi:hypothetical protein